MYFWRHNPSFPSSPSDADPIQRAEARVQWVLSQASNAQKWIAIYDANKGLRNLLNREEQLLGESLLLLDIGARRERAAESRRENLLRIGRRPHSGPKEVEIIGLRLQQVGAALSADRWRPERTMGTLCRGALVCRG